MDDSQGVFEVVEGVVVLVVVENALPHDVRKERLAHSELFEEGLRVEELEHDDVGFLGRVE